MDYTTNEYRIKRTQKKLIPAKVMEEIVKRQEISALMKAREKIEDYKNDVFSVIENDGIKSEDPKTRLKTSLDVLEYIVPKKKSSEVTITTRKIEDLIQETIQEAEIISNENIGQNDSNKANSEKMS